MAEYDWIEFQVRPKKDGLHDSGYRYIKLVGCRGETREYLNQWSDHVLFHGPVNIDVTPDGVIRIMPWFGAGHGHRWNAKGLKGRWINTDADGGIFVSSAMFYANDGEAAADSVLASNRIHFEVLADVCAESAE